jgi:hypothetical protein
MTLGRDGQPWPVRLGAVPGYQLLWLGVVERAIHDAAQAHRKTRRWLSVRSADLLWVLTACNLDHEFWFERVVPELHEQWRVLDDARDLGLPRREAEARRAEEASRLSA